MTGPFWDNFFSILFIAQCVINIIFLIYKL